MLSKKKYYLFFFLILILAFLLRFLNFFKIPPSMYWEELALGYDAYSIRHTLRDHHGNLLPIIAFESFGDYKPSFYFYLVAFNLLFLPLDFLAVRLPSILSGVLIVLGFNLFWRIFDKKKYHWQSLSIMLLASFNPWLIHFSRSGWESNVATFLIFYGVIFSVKAIQSLKGKLSRNYFIVSQIFFGLSFYTYHSARFVAPLLICFLYFVYLIKEVKKPKNFRAIISILIIPIIINSISFLPLFFNLNNKNVNNRFAETSIFSNIEVIEKSNQYKNFHENNFLSKIFYHRYYLFLKIILNNFFQHFDFDFLFLNGDVNLRHSSRDVGLFYLFDSIILFLGIIFLSQSKKFFSKFSWILWFFLFWLFLGIFPASISKTTPHSLRILNTSVIFIFVLNFGVIFLINFFRKIGSKFFKIFLMVIILTVYLLQISIHTFYYCKIYPKASQSEWQYGYEEILTEISNEEMKFNQIYIVRDYGRPAMAYFFYNKINPKLVQKLPSQSKKDQAEFLEFLNIKFINSLNEVDFTKDNILVIFSDKTDLKEFNKIPEDKKNLIKKVSNLNNKIIWQSWQIN